MVDVDDVQLILIALLGAFSSAGLIWFFYKRGRFWAFHALMFLSACQCLGFAFLAIGDALRMNTGSDSGWLWTFPWQAVIYRWLMVIGLIGANIWLRIGANAERDKMLRGVKD